MVRIHCNVSGTPTDTPVIIGDTGDKYTGVLNDTQNRVTFTLPDGTPPGGWGATVVWQDSTARFVVPTEPGDYEGGLLTPEAIPTLDYAPPVRPFTPVPRTYAGNLCGIYIDGLPPVPGGARNSNLLLTWFYDRYDAPTRARIRAEYKRRGFSDMLLSWPDSRAVGQSPDQFLATCEELRADGLEPCVMLYSKDYDPSDVPEIERRMAQILPLLKERVGRICVGWELSIALTPTQVQQLIDFCAPQVTPWGGRLYVHFQAGYASFQQPGKVFADFWNANVGKLTGLLWQADVSWPEDEYRYRCADILDRFAGQFFCAPDSGFGHPFDCIGFELTAMRAFNENLSETEQDSYARTVVNTPAVMGPLGPVSCMGSGNGRG